MLTYLSYSVQWTEQFFNDLNLLLDRVHAFFDEIETARSGALSVEGLQQAKLVLHEWLANLIQHADFGERTPEVTINVSFSGAYAQYVVEDNSQGFDFYGKLRAQQDRLGALPDRGMGLLMIQACSRNLSYRHVAEHRHRLTFSIPARNNPRLNIPLTV